MDDLSLRDSITVTAITRRLFLPAMIPLYATQRQCFVTFLRICSCGCVYKSPILRAHQRTYSSAGKFKSILFNRRVYSVFEIFVTIWKNGIRYIYIYFSFFLARKRFINVCPWDGNIRLSSSRRKLCINGSVAGAPHTRPDRWITRNDDPSEERCFCQGLRPSFFFSSSFPIERVLRSIKPTSR